MVAVIVSREAGLVTWHMFIDAGAVAISIVVAVLPAVRVIITAEAHVVSTLCSSLGAGSVAWLILP